jgi:hypothetical protein
MSGDLLEADFWSLGRRPVFKFFKLALAIPGLNSTMGVGVEAWQSSPRRHPADLRIFPFDARERNTLRCTIPAEAPKGNSG